MEYLLIFIANLADESFLPSFGRYDSLSRTVWEIKSISRKMPEFVMRV